MEKKLFSWQALAIALGILAIGSVVMAFSGTITERKIIVDDQVVKNDITVEEISDNQEESLGAFPGPQFDGEFISFNGDTYSHKTDRFANATTTFVSIPNPFKMATSSTGEVVLGYYSGNATTGGRGYTGATTTVELLRLNISGAATTTYSVTCGACNVSSLSGTASAFFSQCPNDYILLTTTIKDAIATSSTGLLENNLTSARGALYDGGTVPKIALTPQYPWLNCVASTTGTTYDGAFTETTNTFDGKYSARFSRPDTSIR